MNATEATFGRPCLTSAPVRKAMSLSSLFRLGEKASSAPSSPNSLYATVKSRKRLSLRRSAASPISSPISLCSNEDYHNRSSQVNSRCLFPDTMAEEETASVVPPQRPSCPAPLLDLSGEESTFFEEHYQYGYRLAEHHSHLLREMSNRCSSEESFQCRGLENEETGVTSPLDKCKSNKRPQLRSRPAFLSLATPAAFNMRQASLLSLESNPSTPSASSEVSLDTPLEDVLSTPNYFSAMTSWKRHSRMETEAGLYTQDLFCPPSPPPKVRLLVTLPPTAQLCSELTLFVNSNSSTLELKELICSTLLDQYDFSISPSNLALLLVQVDGEKAALLENDRPLYQEGMQDDDEIIARF